MLIHPVRHVYITQKWGLRPEVYARFGLKGHNGVDYRLFDESGKKANTAVLYAPHGGKVLETKDDGDGYGKYIKIENEGEGSILGHLKSFNVVEGQSVSIGQKIGVCNNTGFSSGPHLHWGYYPKPRNRANGYSGTIDQLPIVKKKITDLEEGDMETDYQKVIDELRNDRDRHWNDLVEVRDALGLGDDEKVETIINSINANKKSASKVKELENQIKTIKEAHEERVVTLNNQLSEKDQTIQLLRIQHGDLIAPYIDQLKTKDELIKQMAEEVEKLKIENFSSSKLCFLERIIKVLFRR